MLLVLRLIHVVGGILWAGFAIFIPTFLGPAIADAGPDGGKVMVALFRRGLMNIVPALGVLTLLSGFWLFWLASSGNPGYMGSRMGMALGTGGTLALLGFIVGMTVLRPSMMRVVAIAQQLPAATPADRERLQADVARFRARGAAAGRAVAALLLLAATAMAVARYL